jgi:hypothetical protein
VIQVNRQTVKQVQSGCGIYIVLASDLSAKYKVQSKTTGRNLGAQIVCLLLANAINFRL